MDKFWVCKKLFYLSPGFGLYFFAFELACFFFGFIEILCFCAELSNNVLPSLLPTSGNSESVLSRLLILNVVKKYFLFTVNRKIHEILLMLCCVVFFSKSPHITHVKINFDEKLVLL